MNSKSLILSLTLLAVVGFTSGPAQARTAAGQLQVGITILDACRITHQAPADGERLAALTGYGLKCSKGADYTLQVSGDASQELSDDHGQTAVTVRF